MSDFSVTGEINLELGKLKEGVVKANSVMTVYAGKLEKQGEAAGKVYVKGFGKGQQDLNKKLNEFVSTMGSISPKMGSIGDKAASLFSKPLVSMVPVVSSAFQMMLPVIGTIVAAVSAVAVAVNKVIERHKQHVAEINALKTAVDTLSGSLAVQNKQLIDHATASEKKILAFKGYTDAVATWGKEAADQQRDAAEADVKRNIEVRVLKENIKEVTEAQNKFALAIKATNDESVLYNKSEQDAAKARIPLIESQISLLIEQRNAAAALASDSSLVKEIDEALKWLNGLRKMNQEIIGESEEEKKDVNLFVQAEQQLMKTRLTIENQIKAGHIDEAEAQKQRLAAENQFIQTVSSLKDEYNELGKLTGEQAAAIQEAEKEHQKTADSLARQIEIQERQAAITAARNAAEENYAKTVRMAEDDYASGLINAMNLQKQINAAREQEYNELEGIVLQYNLTEGATVNLRNETAEMVKLNKENAQEIENQRKALENEKAVAALISEQEDVLIQQQIERAEAEASVAETEEEQNRYKNLAVILENELIEKQRFRAREALEDSDEFKNASDEEREKLLKNFDLITAGMRKSFGDNGEKKKILDSFEEIAGKINEVEALVANAGQSALSIMSSIAREEMTEVEKTLAEEKERIEGEYNAAMELLDEERQRALEAAGFAAAVTEEGMAASMEAALASGDEKTIYEEKRRQEELRINQEYDEKEKQTLDKKNAETKKAEQEAAQKKADIDYESAMASWLLQITQAPGQAAAAILQAMAALVPVAGAAVGGVLTALQIGALMAAVPKKQTVKFAQGGAFANGIYTEPMPFMFAGGGEFRSGLMGEAGPEAVMPLVRDAAGSLGVQAVTGGEGATINVVVTLDGGLIAKNTVAHLNNGDTAVIDAVRVV